MGGAQQRDPEIRTLLQKALAVEETKDEFTCVVYLERGLLKMKWRRVDAPAEESKTYHQVVLPRKYRQEVIQTAHEDVTDHLGGRKTGDAILQYIIFLPGWSSQVK